MRCHPTGALATLRPPEGVMYQQEDHTNPSSPESRIFHHDAQEAVPQTQVPSVPFLGGPQSTPRGSHPSPAWEKACEWRQMGQEEDQAVSPKHPEGPVHTCSIQCQPQLIGVHGPRGVLIKLVKCGLGEEEGSPVPAPRGLNNALCPKEAGRDLRGCRASSQLSTFLPTWLLALDQQLSPLYLFPPLLGADSRSQVRRVCIYAEA